MPKALIHQIFYSEQTRALLDPGFLPLDNSANPRPDWREYWPIRAHLQAHPLGEDCYHGFFSPKFREKTGLASAQVHNFAETRPPDTDVVLFSPFFDQSAFYVNVIEHGMNHHPGFLELARDVLRVVAPSIRLEHLVNDSRDTVFCNYFVARPRFWQRWLALCEQIFALAENHTTPLAARLNEDAKYHQQGAPAKVFLIERMATLILATEPGWRVEVHDPLGVPIDTAFANYHAQLICLDALKIAARLRGQAHYLDVYRLIRQGVVADTKARYSKPAG